MVETTALFELEELKTAYFIEFPFCYATSTVYTDDGGARLLGIVQNEFDIPGPVNARLRRLWLNIHLWVGLGPGDPADTERIIGRASRLA